MHKQQLPINNPCTQDWQAMKGDDRQRHCGVCDRPVHNLSAMTREQAQPVLQARSQGQRLCIRYTAGEDGEIRFQRPALIPAGLLVRTRQVALRATLAAAVVAAGVELPGCVPAGPVSGAIATRAAADLVVDKLAAAGTCAISLEPLLPLSLTLHAAACRPPLPIETALDTTPPPPVPPPKGTPPPAPQDSPATDSSPGLAKEGRHRPTRAPKKSASAPKVPPRDKSDVTMGW